MAPTIAFVLVTAATRFAGRLGWSTWLDSWPHAARCGLAIMFLLGASAHFLQPRRDALIAMVPPVFANASAVVTFTGVLEILGAVGLLIPLLAPAAAVGLAILLVAIFPANVRAARTGEGIQSMPLPLRTLVQVVFIGACVVAAL
ncbi:DoxX family protein [Nocardia sp. NPDC101769]|uniref:DoxX family protein n=1 Tax=Nocardia sp. NPDC101769 TaxID=3364333 RepID=UPI00382A275A